MGEDIKYLSEEEEINSHKLYNDLNIDLDEEEGITPELAYLSIIRKIRDEQTDLFTKIKSLPKKLKVGKQSGKILNYATVTFLRKGYFKTFYKSDEKTTEGMTFLNAIDLIKCEPDEPKININERYFTHLEKNKIAFDYKLSEEEEVNFENVKIYGNDAKMITIIKAIIKCPKLTTEQDNNLKVMLELWQNGVISEAITKEILRDIKNIIDPLQAYFEIYDRIPEHYFYGRNNKKDKSDGKKEVILSCYLENKK